MTIYKNIFGIVKWIAQIIEGFYSLIELKKTLNLVHHLFVQV